jgi:hypothetical protein
MKKLYTNIIMIMTAMTILTGCEHIEVWEEDMESWEDRQEARTLDGTWTGRINTYYYDRWGLTGDSYRTTMYFERETAYSGWGYEVSYDDYSRYSDYYYCEFKWDIYKGSIRIRYADSWNDVFINDYHLSDSYFDGYMDDGTSKDIVFRLNYDSRFDWSYWRTRSLTRSGDNGVTFEACGKFAKE